MATRDVTLKITFADTVRFRTYLSSPIRQNDGLEGESLVPKSVTVTELRLIQLSLEPFEDTIYNFSVWLVASLAMRRIDLPTSSFIYLRLFSNLDYKVWNENVTDE